MNSRFLAPYYLLNWTILLTYFPLRRIFLTVDESEDSNNGFQVYEMQAVLVLVLIAFLKYHSSPTLDAYFSTFFRMSKMWMLALFVLLNWKIAIWYGLVLLVLSLSVKQPEYTGPAMIEELTAGSFESVVTSKKSRRWIVMLLTNNSTSSKHLYPLFAKLSLEYSCKELKFAKIDVGRYFDVAKRHNIHVSDSNQIPTFILFDQGKEVSRLPQITKDNKVVSCTFSKRKLETHFMFSAYCKKDAELIHDSS